MKLIFLPALMLVSVIVYSQSSLPVRKTETAFTKALNEVVKEYFNDFENSKGTVLSETTYANIYESRLALPQAVSAVIHQYFVPDGFSWESVLLETDEYDLAVKKYNELYKQMNNMKLTPNGFEKVTLIGNYDKPDEGRSFAASKFSLEKVKNDRNNFFIELTMQYQFPDWTVKIFMYEKTPDEQMRQGMRSLK